MSQNDCSEKATAPVTLGPEFRRLVDGLMAAGEVYTRDLGKVLASFAKAVAAGDAQVKDQGKALATAVDCAVRHANVKCGRESRRIIDALELGTMNAPRPGVVRASAVQRQGAGSEARTGPGRVQRFIDKFIDDMQGMR